ncbi:tetraacyldisaccharide 4'-kinase [Hoeflea prorocentri]|uniref:Tetraacyldisaccharide 4'-kinase n=1 Tax=Hoeflea prorocentri TaxID=1922333 RepID=A0A9X3UJ10_9HYPH|nr:tetraacyldisaccharide 4'-kinase [Hoeflea prorocentri]MCY6382247.1 tetraacyldisaccharide 4'-kinase [Hoeflea prorocentri]MDA5400047.1 tetraacyldisaccharide 4'-kinase [Hoeflea prorocentri]
MVSEAPPFWWTKADWRAWSLAPISWIYGVVARSRMENAPRVAVDVPVLCVGNFTVGGAGKTPTALALCAAAKKAGLKPGFLSRGYGGSIRTATVVDTDHHNAGDVGDEPLLLAQKALTVVSPERAAGAARLIEEGADFIIMDDGFQSAAVRFDFALMVVDSLRGIGNGHVIPGGPVRAPMVDQMRHASALLVIGDGPEAHPVIRVAGRAAKPVYEAKLKVIRPRRFRRKKVLAYAAIGNPEKFFVSLNSAGADIVDARGFGDHHHFVEDEATDLLDTASARDLQLVTTAKDMVRLRHARGKVAELAEKSDVLEVQLEFDPPGLAQTFVEQTVQSFKKKALL